MKAEKLVVRYPRSRCHTHECIDPRKLLQQVLLQIKATHSLAFCPRCSGTLSEPVCSLGFLIIDLTKASLLKSCIPCGVIWELDVRSDQRIATRFSTPFLFLKGVYNCGHQQLVFEGFEEEGWIAL